MYFDWNQSKMYINRTLTLSMNHGCKAAKNKNKTENTYKRRWTTKYLYPALPNQPKNFNQNPNYRAYLKTLSLLIPTLWYHYFYADE